MASKALRVLSTCLVLESHSAASAVKRVLLRVWEDMMVQLRITVDRPRYVVVHELDEDRMELGMVGAAG
jgi:hypothetical protein